MTYHVDALKSELEGLLKERAFAIAEISQQHRSQTGRIDKYVSLIREVLSCSSLCYVDDRMMFFDGCAYIETSVRRLSVILSNLLSLLA